MPLALFRTVRSKLLLAFCLIVGLSVAIGSIGWSGFSDSERALNSLRDHSLPNIDKAMELARRSSAVASIAPFLSSIQVMNKLNVENEKLEAQLAELKAMVDALEPLAPGDKPPAGSLHDLASRMASNLQSLVQNTHDSLDIRSDMLELAYAFERRGKIEARLRVQAGGPGASSVRLEAFKGLTETIFAAIGNDNPVEIGELQKAFAGFSRELTPNDGSVDGTTVLSSGDPETDAFVKLQSRVFDIRRREIAAHQTTQYLLASIHALSTQMSDKVADVASNISQSVQAESARTNAALENGKNRILLLTLICLLASAAAVTYVLRNLAGNLQTITTAISRLASGDRTTHVPAVERADEIGILARAFNVFKEQSFDREALASDLIAKSRVLEATFANMADGLSVFDENGRLTAWNAQFIEVNELDSAHVRAGKRFEDIVVRMLAAGAVMDGAARLPADAAAMFRQRQGEATRCEWTFPSGRVVEQRSQPMDGGFATIHTDLTERRTMDRKLRQAQHMEAVGQLTSGVAHDFNNLLAAVSGNLQMLHESLHDRRDLTPRILRALDAAERGATMTQRLLAFSRQQALQPETTDINALIRNLVELLDCSLGSSIRLETHLQADLEEVFVDPGQLEHAILNLIFNSRDAMPSGGRIRISSSSAAGAPASGTSRVRIAVEDDGEGMSPDVMARAYEPFFTTKEQGRGSGLGLSMVYGFVTQSGGQVDIASTRGSGTRIVITLPRRTATAAKGFRRPEAIVGGTAATPKESILIVEDDRLVRDTTADMLLSLGYSITAVATIDEARKALDDDRFDLLFTDFVLSEGVTGDDVAACARSADPQIAVLYTSGYPRDKLRDELQVGLDINLIGKPFSKAALATAIRGLLDVRRQSQSAPRPH